jgi:hypothetical protein
MRLDTVNNNNVDPSISYAQRKGGHSIRYPYPRELQNNIRSRGPEAILDIRTSRTSLSVARPVMNRGVDTVSHALTTDISRLIMTAKELM